MMNKIKEFAEEIKKVTGGEITNPEEQAVIFTEEDLHDYIIDEWWDEVREDFADCEGIDLEDEDYEDWFPELDLEAIQETAYQWSFLDTYAIMMDGELYFVANIDNDDYQRQGREAILDYATWYNEDYYDNK